MRNKNTDLECNQCGHEWSPRKKKPKVCPECGSTHWNDPEGIGYVENPKNQSVATSLSETWKYRLELGVENSSSYYTVSGFIRGAIKEKLKREKEKLDLTRFNSQGNEVLKSP